MTSRNSRLIYFILPLVTFINGCSSLSGVKTAYFIKTDKYLSGEKPSKVHYECNLEEIIISKKENNLLSKAKSFTDSIGIPFFINILDSSQVYFRRSPLDPLKYPQTEIQGTVPFSMVMNGQVPSDLLKITSILRPKNIGDTIMNVVIPSDSSNLDNNETEIISTIFLFIKSLFEDHNVEKFQSEGHLEFSTGDRSYQWEPEELMSCDPKEDYVVLYDHWLIHDYGLHRKIKQYDKKDPYPYEIVETKDSLITKYRTKEDGIVSKPCNLRDAHLKMDIIFKENNIAISEKSEMIDFHFGLGMWMRNNWGLWSGKSRLIPFFKKKSISHPDNMSGYILDTYKTYAIIKRDNPESIDSLYSELEDIECKYK